MHVMAAANQLVRHLGAEADPLGGRRAGRTPGNGGR
jgi:hypothetical protein